jgi:hypothetical protein
VHDPPVLVLAVADGEPDELADVLPPLPFFVAGLSDDPPPHALAARAPSVIPRTTIPVRITTF